VVRTLVPEAAIDEDRDLRLRKDDVGSAAQARHRLNVFAEAQASAMQLRAQRDLWPGFA
jgi:hypothetical protein